jgi:hypothetical protein
MKFADTNLPEAKMLSAMYGPGFDYRWAIVNGMWVCRITSEPNAIYKLIDQVKAGPPAHLCLEMQKAMTIMPNADNADVFITYNYPRLLNMMTAMMPSAMPRMEIFSKSNLVFAAKVANGSATIDAALPKEHLQEMMMMFQMMMEQQMQQQQMKQPAPMPNMPPAP